MGPLGEAGIRDCTKTIGIFRNRAKNTCALLGMLHDHFETTVPFAGKPLMSPPSGRRKSGNVIMWEPAGSLYLSFTRMCFVQATALAWRPEEPYLISKKS